MIENIDCSKEIWKAIECYEGLYEVSNWGRVRSFPRVFYFDNGKSQFRCARILKQSNLYGYRVVGLKDKNGIVHTTRVHRLVASAFIPNPNNLPQINHKNEIRYDNKVENLEWCNGEYNTNYGTRNLRAGQHIRRDVFAYDANWNLIGKYNSLKDASDNLGVNMFTIGGCINNHRLCLGKYHFSHHPKTNTL
jgi:hypothetical protein